MTDESASKLYNWDDFEVPQHTPFTGKLLKTPVKQYHFFPPFQTDMQRRRINKENVCPEGLVKNLEKLNLNAENIVLVPSLSTAIPVQKSLVPTSPTKTPRKPLTRSQVAQPPPQSKGAIKKTTTAQPLHNYATMYKAKKERKMKQLQEEEKRMRQFHSKPVPNFTVRHRKLDQQLEQNKKLPSCPITPRTLKTSQAISEAQKIKVRILCVKTVLSLIFLIQFALRSRNTKSKYVQFL